MSNDTKHVNSGDRMSSYYRTDTKLNVESGFTLIELSIVLVIIGLIVGGVLVGRDLIKSAEVRATVGQVEKYNSAVNTFRSKYNGLPGDLTQTQATYFGLYTLTGAGPAAMGDGNGLIEGGSAGATVGEGETILFWRHLSDANLIDGNFGSVAATALIVPSTGLLTADVTTPSQSLPGSKISPTNYFIVYAYQGLNYFQLTPVKKITAASGAYSYNNFGITPIQAYNIDNKLDDGMPETGAVTAQGIAAVNAAPSSNASSTAATCVIGNGTANTDTYNRIAATGGNDGSCSLRFRFN